MPALILMAMALIAAGATQSEACKEAGIDAKECVERVWDARQPFDYDKMND